MSPVVDETAGDLPVRDVGLVRGGLMPTVPDSLREVRSWKKHHIIKMKADPQRLFRFPREHLEDLCLRLQEENSALKQHTRTQEHRLRRMSTRLARLRQASPGSGGGKDRDMEDTIQELETRVVMLESQKGMLQNKLSLAKQHILDLGGRTPYKFGRCKNMDSDGGVRRAAQTAPARCGLTLEDTRTELERLCGATEQVRMAELELTAQSLRDTLREKEREMDGTVRELRKQQADRHRITIRENVDVIRLKKQLSDKNVALRVTQEKFNNLQQALENQMEESQKSMRNSQAALLAKVEELTNQLKEERQRSLTLEGQLTSTSLSLQSLDKFQERIFDLEGERDLIKGNYDSLLNSTLAVQIKSEHSGGKKMEESVEYAAEGSHLEDIHRLEDLLQAERDERSRLEEIVEGLRGEKEKLEEQREHEGESSMLMKEKQEDLEQQVVRYKQQISALQDKLDSVTKVFDMSVEELSETLLQIRTFRMQQESRESLHFLTPDKKLEDPTHEFVNIQATHAETVLELQKTRDLLLLEHQISKDLQEELNTLNQKMEREREEIRRRLVEKDKILSKRASQINTLQAQLKELAYSPRNYKRTIPIQYTWPAGDWEVVQSIEDDLFFSQLKAEESLLEIHLKGATFTPAGLRVMSSVYHRAETNGDIMTFCTFSLLDFEMNSTALVSGSQPNYGFTSRYALTPRDLGLLQSQEWRVPVELHQSLGGVKFITVGAGHISVTTAVEKRGERISGRLCVTGRDNEMVGAVDYWVRLLLPAEAVGPVTEVGAERRSATFRNRVPVGLSWQDRGHEELHDFGGGIPNEVVVRLERCVGLSARWPGLLPDAYLTYRLYDLPAHVSQTVQCSADPVINDATSYPLAVTNDILNYFRCSSLWVYVFDESDDQVPPTYLAKTPVPLRALASGKEIRGDYVLRDAAGGPRGMVRVMLKWKYPFQPPGDEVQDKKAKEVPVQTTETPRPKERTREETSQKPVAKPRTQRPGSRSPKAVPNETKAWPQPPPAKQKASRDVKLFRVSSTKQLDPRQSRDRKRSKRMSSDGYQRSPHLTPELRLSPPPTQHTAKSSASRHSRHSPAPLTRGSSASDVRTQDLLSVDQATTVGDQEEEEDWSERGENDGPETSESSSSDIVVIPPKRKTKTGDKLKVEILSLMLEPRSRVALDESVQRVYVEYRLRGVPMETTETPMSLRKPTKGEEIHYNFTRVIYVDGSQASPLRQYLYTMLEGRDPNRSRLKFTVVSEPMDDNEDCVDVGHAFLDLQELLLTGNDVIEQQIEIVSVEDEDEVMGHLKVSVEAAKALTGIYQEFRHRGDKRDETEEEEEEEEKKKQEEKEKKKDQLKVLDYDDDSDFY